MLFFGKQEQQHVTVGPGNAQFMSIRQVPLRRTDAAADAIRQYTD